MITYTQERYAALCDAYLEHIEKTQSNPAAFVASEIRRLRHIYPEDETYLMLMLLDQEDRKTLGNLLVRIHYATEGKNILVETKDGLVGEDAEASARELIDGILARSARFVEAVHREQKHSLKKVNKKINGLVTTMSALRKENRILGSEIKQLLDQVTKKRTRIEKNEARLQELAESLEQLRNPADDTPADENQP